METYSQDKAFTLIELLVVVALIAILSTIGIVSYSGYAESAAQKAAENSLSAMRVAQEEYKLSNSKYYGSDGNNCTVTTTQNINKNLFQVGTTSTTDMLTEQRYFFCSQESTGLSLKFTLTAKHKTDTCVINLTGEGDFTRTGCA
jgi:type IV pilus assembly protein PilE